MYFFVQSFCLLFIRFSAFFAQNMIYWIRFLFFRFLFFHIFYVNNNNICIILCLVRPVLVRIEGDRKPLSAEKVVEVSCTSAGSRPPATISWWKGSTKMKRTRDKISVDGNVTTSTLTFTPNSDDSGKYLSCRSENTLIQTSAIEDGVETRSSL